MNSEKNFVVSLLTKTWVRDSHGLYDYESTQTKNLNAVLADNVLIARKKHEIKTVTSKNDLQEDEFLLGVKYEKENPVQTALQPDEKNINDLSNKLWYVLYHDDASSSTSTQTVTNTNEDYYLCKNDIIKLGRVKYALNEIHIPEKNNNFDVEMIPLQENEPGYNISHLNMHQEPVFDFIFQARTPEVETDDNMCKICYSTNNETQNPLVHMCKCSGGIRFAHYECIKKWMETKLSIKENEKKTVKSYNIKSFNCEICKMPYPFRFKILDKPEIFDLIDITRPDSNNYIVLESLNQMKENCNIKSIHIIQLTNDIITIGRGHESDVRINDISVSRTHALLKYNPVEGKLLLRDLKSKFGTLVLIKQPVLIKERKIHLQIGRTYIEASLMTMKEFEKLKKEKKTNKYSADNNQTPNTGNAMPIDFSLKLSTMPQPGNPNPNQTQKPKTPEV